MSKPLDVVVQVESRHSGVTTYSFIAPPTALLELASKLERLARAPLGARFDEYISSRGNPSARTALAFAQCAPEHLSQLQALGARVHGQRAVLVSIYFTVALFFFAGVIAVVRSLLAWLH
jgi:hypothetical protein